MEQKRYSTFKALVFVFPLPTTAESGNLRKKASPIGISVPTPIGILSSRWWGRLSVFPFSYLRDLGEP